MNCVTWDQPKYSDCKVGMFAPIDFVPPSISNLIRTDVPHVMSKVASRQVDLVILKLSVINCSPMISL
ncbi:hypothetical protein HMI54_005098 [Coelomomyces lativittatus]|nr:hypothetical protein HMI54_005098 [Coelomomyces lativittatus]